MTAAVEEDGGPDLWAVKVVVQELLPMELTRPERVLAAQLLKRRGLTAGQIGKLLGVSEHVVNRRYWRDKPPVAIADLDPTMLGGVIKRLPSGFPGDWE